MKRLVIGLDIDGVIVDCASVMLPLLSKVCHRTVHLEDISSWDLKEALNIDEKAENYIWENILGTDLLSGAPPVQGAVDGLSCLDRHEIWIVTGRPAHLREVTESWLEKRRIKYDNILFIESGSKISAGLEFDVFVEDYLEEARLFANAGVLTLLFNQPWNQAPELPARCRRVYDWNQVLAEVKKLEK
jgi:uncharacterized HAD superfamily protein